MSTPKNQDRFTDSNGMEMEAMSDEERAQVEKLRAEFAKEDDDEE